MSFYVPWVISAYLQAWLIGQNLPVKEVWDSAVPILRWKKMPINEGIEAIPVSEEQVPQVSLVLKFLLVWVDVKCPTTSKRSFYCYLHI